MQSVIQKYSLMLLRFWWLPFLLQHLFFQYSNMRYDKNGLPVREYYKEGNVSTKDKMKAVENQKYYTGGAIIFMFAVLVGMYAILS